MEPEFTWKNTVFLRATIILAFSWPLLAIYWSVLGAVLLCAFNCAFLYRFKKELTDALASVIVAWKLGPRLSLIKKCRLARWCYCEGKAFEVYKRAFYGGKGPRKAYDEAWASQITLSDL